MSSVVVVDWLGRGGIAHCTTAWVRTLQGAGHATTVVTRAGRELVDEVGWAVTADARGHALLAHAAVARAAADAVRTVRPSTVIVQNYVVPFLERPLYAAVRDTGARLVVVVHDHRLHSAAAGTRAGLRGVLRRADAVVCHSRFVAQGVSAYCGRDDVQVTPLPVQLGVVGDRLAEAAPQRARMALHFGVVKRAYKGLDLVSRLAAEGADGWDFVVAGAGVPERMEGATTVPGFVSSPELAALLERSSATILPYRMATQSGAVRLAQALGSVPVASAVGGIPEQVVDGETGVLLPPDAGVAAWREALRRLAEPGLAERLGAQARQAAWADHRRFAATVTALAC
jgi:glycosyltransferase involved in cell wall biosynthesis